MNQQSAYLLILLLLFIVSCIFLCIRIEEVKKLKAEIKFLRKYENERN